MALTDENMVMPVTPMNNGNNGFGGFFGGDASWIILFLFFAMFGGWGGGFGDFAQAVNGMPIEHVMSIIDELMTALYVDNRAMYRAVLRQLSE